MAELIPAPFARLLRRMLREAQAESKVFDLPARRFWRGAPDLDTSVLVHGHRAANPAGPAAGPHGQMAQNILLSWLAGGRFVELKTVQVDDRLEIPRPCIDMETVGYNVEWSQELRLAESLREYVKGSMLIDVARAEGLLGRPDDPARDETVLDLSLGYDLSGVRSPAVRAWAASMKDARAEVDTLRREIPDELRRLRDVDFRTALSDQVTLSTFHGCPAGEIEAMASFLMEELGLHVTVKLNPTLLGKEAVDALLHDVLGYHDVETRAEDFARDLQWEQALELADRLTERARALGRRAPAQAVEHAGRAQPPPRLPAGRGRDVPLGRAAARDHDEPRRARAARAAGRAALLLRGRRQPQLRRLRRARPRPGHRLHGPAEAGRLRPPAALPREPRAADARARRAPRRGLRGQGVRPGGAGDRRGGRRLRRCGRRSSAPCAPSTWTWWPCSTRRGGRHDYDAIVSAAAALNTPLVVARATADPRYRAEAQRPPRRVERRLTLFDCINCDKCLPACPNDANFVYEDRAARRAVRALSRRGRTACGRSRAGASRCASATRSRPSRTSATTAATATPSARRTAVPTSRSRASSARSRRGGVTRTVTGFTSRDAKTST